jgi:hypothetical protein
LGNKYTDKEIGMLKGYLICIVSGSVGPDGSQQENPPIYQYTHYGPTKTYAPWKMIVPMIKNRFRRDNNLKIFLDKPISDMPLYINHGVWSGYAKWRLEINK